jgi:hypothetical protein
VVPQPEAPRSCQARLWSGPGLAENGANGVKPVKRFAENYRRLWTLEDLLKVSNRAEARKRETIGLAARTSVSASGRVNVLLALLSRGRHPIIPRPTATATIPITASSKPTKPT